MLAIVFLLAAAALAVVHHARVGRARVPAAQEVLAEVIGWVDSDHDGRISISEWKAFRGNDDVFNAYDFNRDGYLDVTEYGSMFYSLDPKQS